MTWKARPITRGLAAGLVAGLFFGGLLLLFLGTRSLVGGPDCGGLTPSECGLEREIVLGMARREIFAGVALALLALASFTWVRDRLFRAADNRSNN
jgi:hypothetical protein